jgi:hypothetical protein
VPVTPTNQAEVALPNEPEASAGSFAGTVFLPWVSDQSTRVETNAGDQEPTGGEVSELPAVMPTFGQEPAQEASYRVYLPITVN